MQFSTLLEQEGDKPQLFTLRRNNKDQVLLGAVFFFFGSFVVCVLARLASG